MLKILIVFIFTLIAFTPTKAKADWLTFLAIASIAESSNTPAKSKEELMISSIVNKLPWGNEIAHKDHFVFHIEPNEIQFYYNFFKNKGYNNVRIQDNKLIFDYLGHELKYKAKQEQLERNRKVVKKALPYIFLIGFIIIVLIKLFMREFNRCVDFYEKAVNRKRAMNGDIPLKYNRRVTIKEKIQFVIKFNKAEINVKKKQNLGNS